MRPYYGSVRSTVLDTIKHGTGAPHGEWLAPEQRRTHDRSAWIRRRVGCEDVGGCGTKTALGMPLGDTCKRVCAEVATVGNCHGDIPQREDEDVRMGEVILKESKQFVEVRDRDAALGGGSRDRQVEGIALAVGKVHAEVRNVGPEEVVVIRRRTCSESGMSSTIRVLDLNVWLNHLQRLVEQDEEHEARRGSDDGGSKQRAC